MFNTYPGFRKLRDSTHCQGHTLCTYFLTSYACAHGVATVHMQGLRLAKEVLQMATWVQDDMTPREVCKVCRMFEVDWFAAVATCAWNLPAHFLRQSHCMLPVDCSLFPPFLPLGLSCKLGHLTDVGQGGDNWPTGGPVVRFIWGQISILQAAAGQSHSESRCCRDTHVAEHSIKLHVSWERSGG